MQGVISSRKGHQPLVGCNHPAGEEDMKENSVAWMLRVAIFLRENSTRTVPTALYLQT